MLKVPLFKYLKWETNISNIYHIYLFIEEIQSKLQYNACNQFHDFGYPFQEMSGRPSPPPPQTWNVAWVYIYNHVHPPSLFPASPVHAHLFFFLQLLRESSVCYKGNQIHKQRADKCFVEGFKSSKTLSIVFKITQHIYLL